MCSGRAFAIDVPNPCFLFCVTLVNNNFSPKQTLKQIGIRIAACTLLLSTLWWACKDIDLYEVPGGREGNITFSGRIIDEAFQPIVGAQVYPKYPRTASTASFNFDASLPPAMA